MKLGISVLALSQGFRKEQRTAVLTNNGGKLLGERVDGVFVDGIDLGVGERTIESAIGDGIGERLFAVLDTLSAIDIDEPDLNGEGATGFLERFGDWSSILLLRNEKGYVAYHGGELREQRHTRPAAFRPERKDIDFKAHGASRQLQGSENVRVNLSNCTYCIAVDAYR